MSPRGPRSKDARRDADTSGKASLTDEATSVTKDKVDRSEAAEKVPTGTRAEVHAEPGHQHHFTSHFADSGGVDFTGDQETAITEETREELRQIAARYPQARSALLPMLHLVQSVEGRVTPAGIEACAEILEISPAQVSGVATFYTMYKRKPMGKHHVGVCTTALCAVMGGDQILSDLQDHLGVGNDETTEDGQITLEHLECNAACDFAPVMMVNWEFFDNMTPDSAKDLVDRLQADEEVTSTRGARICSWRDAERVLAGFPDGRADEGPTSGPASQLGLTIAQEQGWQAPTPTEQDGAGQEGADADQAGAKAGQEDK
ncbi:MAG TPA: NADH-quinone oxidoreductase subunit NuoE [Candidatus Avipropionibacterium avicola]|uniref:NADH-quinone oxidoreductase subunit NuoE n=1 Tax=Candidatus Avipropionibacterium avicola TaxID=2840701 RepID=A0A9D1GXF8_9ACTN|nr:NADH-quinone oxidoreductase subunit NuoE [Candidatus Avipropionibacterium avicola]